MSSTKNTKDNRQVVVARYYAPESLFTIPDGLDLEDKSVVQEWWVNWDILHINYVNGEESRIEPTWNAEESIDYKRPEDCEIKSAGDVNYEYEEAESESETDSDAE